MPSVLITGSSSGFGLLSVVEFAKRGFDVWATMRNPSRCTNLDEKLQAQGIDPTTIRVEQLDVTNDESVANLAQKTDQSGGIDILVNNAGVGMAGFVHDTSLDEFKDVMETNYFGTVRVTKALLRGMLQRKSGRIINVSSISGRAAFPGFAAYAASKHAVEAFTEALRVEVISHGVWASLVEPGAFRTEIMDSNRRDAKNILDPQSPHYEAVRELIPRLEKQVIQNADDPVRVAKIIVKAATEKRPKLRYLVGRDAVVSASLKDVLPGRAWEEFVLRLMGLEGAPKSS